MHILYLIYFIIILISQEIQFYWLLALRKSLCGWWQIFDAFYQEILEIIIKMNTKKQDKEDGIVDGFSSDQQLKHEQIIFQEQKKIEVEVSHKQEVKFKIPPPQEIKSKSYSLNPDMATGWAPKSQLPVPIPMFFQSRRVDSIVRRFLEKKMDKMKLIFLGPRYQNTFYAWYDKAFQFPYSHIRAPHNMKFTNRAFCGQHWDAQSGPHFDSFFESGNLDLVIQVDQYEYDIYLRVDSNTRGHLQWFNFKVNNLQKLQKYRFNICNLQKNRSLYSRGQKPYIFSAKKYEKEKKGWQQSGDSIKFDQKISKSAKILNSQFSSGYKLSFDYYTEYENDKIQMAYCIPYTYTQLISYLKSLQKKLATKQFFTLTKLCNSLGGIQIPLIIIHENYNKETQAKVFENNVDGQYKSPKKCIIISGRMHPGQSNGSHMMHGFLQFLCGQSKQAKLLRENFVFKIVPMLNPDGVILGNYRTGVSGRDFNRQYKNPDKSIFPEVYSFKKFVIENKTMYKQNLLMFLDFHGHSTKKNVFVYGPQFPIIQKHYYECRVFPKLLGNHTNMFRYYSCSFKVSEFKQTTARAIFLRKVMIPLSYTIQASNGSFYDHEALKDIPFNLQNWEEMGKKIGTALAQYAELIISSQKFRLEKMQSRKIKKDIKIRKSSKGKPSSQIQQIQLEAYQQKQIALLDTQDGRIKKIFEEIKKADEEKQINKNEQDDISEGSSDGEGQKDDLSPQKLNFLFQIIKNKKTNVSDKIKKKIVEEQNKHFKTNEQQQPNEIQPLQLIVKPIEMEHASEQFDEDRSQCIFRNAKGYFLKNKNPVAYLQSEPKKEKIAAKIINFSFIGHARPIERKNLSRVDMIDPVSLSKIDRSSINEGMEHKNKINNNRVLDLSDNSFRQTCLNIVSKDTAGTFKPSTDRKNMTFLNISPRKLGLKIDEQKYRKFLLDQFRI